MAYIGSLPTDMTRRRPEEGKGEGRRWGGCHIGVRSRLIWMLSKKHLIWNLQANLTSSSFLLSYSWTGSRLLLHSNICPLHTISHKKTNFCSDLFSLHIFVRLKDLHGWKQKDNKNISVKQIQHGRICKIKSIHRGFHQLVCMKHLRRCMWLWKRWMWRWMWWWSSRGGTFPPCSQ